MRQDQATTTPQLPPGDRPVLYQSAKIVFAAPVGLTIPDATSHNAEAKIHFNKIVEEAAILARRPGGLITTFATPDRVTTPDEVRRAIRKHPVDSNDMAIFDAVTGDILDLIPIPEFLKTHTKISNGISRYARVENGSDIRLVVKDLNAGDADIALLTLEGDPVPNKKKFLENRILTFRKNLTIIANDHVAALTALQYAPINPRNDPDELLFITHICAILEVALSRCATLTPYETAMLSTMSACIHGEDPYDSHNVNVTTPLAALVHAMACIEKRARTYPNTPAVRTLCAVTNSALTTYVPLTPDGETAQMYEQIDELVSLTLNETDDARRQIGADAAITQLSLVSTHGQAAIVAVSQLLAAGEIAGTISARDDQSIEVIDLAGARYAVMTNISQGVTQVACWTRRAN